MTQAHPLVFGMRSLWPGQLGRVEMHQTRTGGDLSHIRPGRTHLNQFLIGGPGWKDQLEEDIHRASELNFRHAYSARRWKRKRKKEAVAIKRNGPVDPWKRDRAEGPIREGVLTASRKFFESDMPGFSDPEREASFRKSAVAFLKEQFGAACVSAWEDCDEEAFHIHFVIAPWVETQSGQAGKQRRLEPSSIPVVKSYEAGHDIAAEYFKGAGLVRGEKRAEARRDAFAAEGKSALPAQNVPCHEWRAQEAVRLDQQRKKAARAWVAARKKEAAVRAAQKRAEDLEKQNRIAEERREKKHAARVEVVEKREAMADKKETEIDKRETRVTWREERAEVTHREQNAFAKKLLDWSEPIRAAAKKLGLKDHPLVKAGINAMDEMREYVKGLGGWER